MGRAALYKYKVAIIAGALLVILGGAGVFAIIAKSSHHTVQSTANTQQRLIGLSYKGQNGVDALTLLKRHATVQTKHYSYGDMVVSINGVNGTGPKYWTFYVNGGMSQVGAGSYVTKDSDKIDWRLQ